MENLDREKHSREKQSLREEIEGRKGDELLLLLKIEQLHKQLEEGKEKKQKLEEQVEVILKQAANLPSTVQIPIQVADLQEHYGHKQGDTEIQQVESHQCIHNV